MPKRRRYAPSELTRFSLKKLRKIVKREAERITKQISRFLRRAESAGIAPEELYTREQLKRPSRAVEKLDAIDLINEYAEMQEKDFTIAGVTQRIADRDEIAEEIGLGKENAAELSPEYTESFIKAKRRAKSESALFYQVLVKSVDYGVAFPENEPDTENDYAFFRYDERLEKMTQTKQGRQKFIREQLKRINDAIQKENKQRDARGADKLRTLSLAQLKRAGYKESLNKSIAAIQERRNKRRKND